MVFFFFFFFISLSLFTVSQTSLVSKLPESSLMGVLTAPEMKQVLLNKHVVNE